MKINLPSKLELSDVYANEPFTIYEMENVLEKNIYNKLREEFPGKSFFTKIGYGSGGKLTFNNTNPLFYKFLEQSETWKMFCQAINNEYMVKKLFNLMMPELKKFQKEKNFQERFNKKKLN